MVTNYTKIILFVIFIIIIIFKLSSFKNNKNKNCNYIIGFWKISTQFKNEANIDDAILYLNKNTNKNNCYDGYLFVKTDGSILYNDTMEFIIKKKRSGNLYSFEMNKCIGNSIPKKLTMELNLIEGSITLKCLKTKQIYFHFFKDNQNSSLISLDINKTNKLNDYDDIAENVNININDNDSDEL